MAKHYRLAVYNLSGERLCTLFDSEYKEDGAAQNIHIEKERSGWKEITFDVSFTTSTGEPNHRVDFLINENQIYLYEDDEVDVYNIKVPTGSHSSKQVNMSVQANHLSEELKAKNLYKYFDDENGIDTCENLIGKALAGSGWELTYCDTFYEADGATEKIRSYSCDTKTGAYTMISEICELFKARPVFNGYDRTVEIYADADTTGFLELNYGKNIDKITRKKDSSNQVTRLYVEGEYGDFGYVGIDSVNPTHLPFIFNFDYYKENGMFTQEHQDALDHYEEVYGGLVENIQENTTDLLQATAELVEAIGTCGYVLSPIINGSIDLTQMITGGELEESDKSYENGDRVALVKSSGEYDYNEYSSSLSLAGYVYILKFVPTITGYMAAHEDLIQVSDEAIPVHLENLNTFLEKSGYAHNETVASLKTAYGVSDLSVVDDDDFDVSGLAAQYQIDTTRSYTATIGETENTANSTQTSLNAEMLDAIANMQEIDRLHKLIAQEQAQQDTENETLTRALGVMLRDGYWSDSNYTVGQEESLYKDALDISKTLAYPIVTYSIEYRPVAAMLGFEDEEPDLSYMIRIYDDELKVNDLTYIDKAHFYPDNRPKDNIELTTDLLNLAHKTFSTMIDRITEMANDVRNNRDVYKRAAAITSGGKFSTELLEGSISILTQQITSISSNWTTDEKGNILFTSLDGQSAMMLSGYGFMVANAKNADGSWKWRTFGTGDGFTADMITTGFLSAERIQAGSIVTNKLSSEVGEELNIGSNEAIALIVDSTQMKVTLDSIVSTVAKVNDSQGGASSSVQQQFANAIASTVVNGETVSTVSQKADKVMWLIENESTSSEIKMTPNAIEAITGDATFKADTITIITDGLTSSAQTSYLGDAIISTVTSSAAYTALDNEVQTQSTAISQLSDEVELKVSQDELETYLRMDSNGVYVGKNTSLFETHITDSAFKIIYYENGRDNPAITVWETTPNGMRSVQLSLDLNVSNNAQVVYQKGTTTGGMLWY